MWGTVDLLLLAFALILALLEGFRLSNAVPRLHLGWLAFAAFIATMLTP